MRRIVLALLVLIPCAFIPSHSIAQPKPLRIGVIPSLTGNAGEQGKNWLDGVQLALDDLRRDGISVDLRLEEDATETKESIAAFQRFATVDKVEGVIGGTWDYLAEAVYPLAERHRIPFLTVTNPIEGMSEQGKRNPWIFTAGMSLEAEAEAVEKFFRNRKISSISIIDVVVPFCTAHAEMITAISQKLQIPVLSQGDLPLEGFMNSLRVAVLKAAKREPALIYLCADYPAIDDATKELSYLKSNSLLLTGQHLDKAFELTGDLARYRSAFGVYPKYDRSHFDKAFTAKFGYGPKVYAAAGYDAMQFLSRTLAAGKNLGDPQTEFSYDGITGTFRVPTTTRQIVRVKAQIVGYESGKLDAVND